MSNRNIQNISLINSIKSESPEEKEQNNEFFVKQINQFEKLVEKDINIIKEGQKIDKETDEKEKGKSINNKENKENEEQNINENIKGNIILIDNRNNEKLLESNLNIDLEKKNQIKENNEDKKISDFKNNIQNSVSDTKNKYKYFDDINNSSIARKEESNICGNPKQI